VQPQTPFFVHDRIVSSVQGLQLFAPRHRQNWFLIKGVAEQISIEDTPFEVMSADVGRVVFIRNGLIIGFILLLVPLFGWLFH